MESFLNFCMSPTSQISQLNPLDSSPEAPNPSNGSVQVLHPDGGIVLAPSESPDRIALIVADYLNWLGSIHGTDMTLAQAIRICVTDIPVANPKPVHGQMYPTMSSSASSTGNADMDSKKLETCELTLGGSVSFRSNAVVRTANPNHEIFKDYDRIKVRCLEGRCRLSRRVLMKENYARHVRELHLGEKRKMGGCTSGGRPGRGGRLRL